ncbi:MAG: hypothetical protein WBC44_16460 [Planctomycetaceae bacterium]
MMARREALETLAVALIGATWGTGCFVVTTAILVGQEGMYLPWFLAAGPLLLVSERLPVAVTGLILAPLLYAATTTALWNIDRSRRIAILATMLYALFLTGPLLGLTGHFWSHEQPFDYSAEVHKTASASRDVPIWFTAMFAGLAGWHAFAWWRLKRFWCDDERTPLVRCLTVGIAATAFGGCLAHGAQVLFVATQTIPQLLTLGPLGFLEFVLPLPNRHWVWVLAAAVTYGAAGVTLTAARTSRLAFWLGLSGVVAFAVGTMIATGYIIMSWWDVTTIPRKIAQGVEEHPALFLGHTLALVAWQVFVVASLWRSCQQGQES